MKRRMISILLTSVLLLSLLAACGSRQAEAEETPPVQPQVQTLSAEGESAGFTDVPTDADYARAVAWCQEQGLMSGTAPNTFSPDMTLNRAMVATVLYRAEKEPQVEWADTFGDVPAGQWYSSSIIWANATGVVGGYGNGLYGTFDAITREQLATILWRYDGQKTVDQARISDRDTVSGYAREAVDWAVGAGVMAYRSDAAFAPKDYATRAEAAMAFYAALSGGAKNQADFITTNGGEVIQLSDLEYLSPDSGSTVYFISDVTPEAMVAVYDALGWEPTGKVAVKLSTGEPPASNYLRPELIQDVVEKVAGTIVECNTAYGGRRASTAMHYQVAQDHGFTDIADFQILDENGSMTLTVNGGTVLSENYVGEHFADYDSYLVLSHFKGHAMAGFGGAIKNISIGLGSSEGKCWIHSGGKSRTSPWGGDQTAFTESMAEAGKSVSDYLGEGERIVYISVMNRISIDCDCNGNPAEPDIHDIGILASTDPVALDQACIDIVSHAQGSESLLRRIERQQGLHTLEHAQEIGLGSRTYQLRLIETN